MRGQFNERGFVLKSLVGVFVLQVSVLGVQVHLCQRKPGDSAACSAIVSSLSDTGKMAIATLLAILIPPKKEDSSG